MSRREYASRYTFLSMDEKAQILAKYKGETRKAAVEAHQINGARRVAYEKKGDLEKIPKRIKVTPPLKKEFERAYKKYEEQEKNKTQEEPSEPESFQTKVQAYRPRPSKQTFTPTEIMQASPKKAAKMINQILRNGNRFRIRT